MPYDRVIAPTLASTWHAASSGAITDELLEWPPDVFALTNVILARSEAFRFAISPIGAWPPEGYPEWARVVEEAGLGWGAWVEDRRGPPPELVGQEWAALKERAGVPLGIEACWHKMPARVRWWESMEVPRRSIAECCWQCSRSVASGEVTAPA